MPRSRFHFQASGVWHNDKVRVQSSQPRSPSSLPVRPPDEVTPKKKEDGFWRGISDDVRDFILHIDHDRIDDIGRITKDAGNGLREAWKFLRDIPAKVFDHPIIADRVDDNQKDFWTDLTDQVGVIAGFTAAGGFAVAGGVKIANGIRKGNWSKALDGLVDAASGTSLALAVAGLAGARALVVPIATGINLARGVFNIGLGYRRGDERRQIQGSLDVSRAVGTFGRLMKSHGAVFKGVGVAMAPVAGALQAGRGFYDLNTGIKNKDKRKEVQGLADIAAAVGTAMAFASGVAVIPGIALAVAANLVKVGYQLSPKFRKKVDKGLTKIEPTLEKAVDKVERLTEPVVKAWKSLLGRFIKRVDAEKSGRFSKAELAEITNLLHSDGKYEREEYNRLRISLEKVGQRKELPKRGEAPPPVRRQELVAELDEPKEKQDFVRFLLVAADYDYKTTSQELDYLRELSIDHLGLSEREFQTLVDERNEQRTRLGLRATEKTTTLTPLALTG